MARFQVEAAFDKDAGVWFVCESNVPGLATEAPTLDALVDKLAVMIPELSEADDDDGEELQFTVTAHHIAGRRLEAA